MTLTHKLWRSAAPFLFGVIGLVPVTLICFWIHTGLGTVALLYLMVVVLVSLKGSFVSSALVSLLAVLCLDHFFTTPLFTIAMNDLPNYMAMSVFVIVSLIITRLVSRVNKQAQQALFLANSVESSEELDHLQGPESSRCTACLSALRKQKRLVNRLHAIGADYRDACTDNCSI